MYAVCHLVHLDPFFCRHPGHTDLDRFFFQVYHRTENRRRTYAKKNMNSMMVRYFSSVFSPGQSTSLPAARKRRMWRFLHGCELNHRLARALTNFLSLRSPPFSSKFFRLVVWFQWRYSVDKSCQSSEDLDGWSAASARSNCDVFVNVLAIEVTHQKELNDDNLPQNFKAVRVTLSQNSSLSW